MPFKVHRLVNHDNQRPFGGISQKLGHSHGVIKFGKVSHHQFIVRVFFDGVRFFGPRLKSKLGYFRIIKLVFKRRDVVGMLDCAECPLRIENQNFVTVRFFLNPAREEKRDCGFSGVLAAKNKNVHPSDLWLLPAGGAGFPENSSRLLEASPDGISEIEGGTMGGVTGCVEAAGEGVEGCEGEITEGDFGESLPTIFSKRFFANSSTSAAFCFIKPYIVEAKIPRSAYCSHVAGMYLFTSPLA